MKIQCQIKTRRPFDDAFKCKNFFILNVLFFLIAEKKLTTERRAVFSTNYHLKPNT